MKTIRNLCIISNLFPPFPYDTSGMFLLNLLTAISRQGVSCTIIRPVSLTKTFLKKRTLPPLKQVEVYEGSPLTIYSPRYISFGDSSRFLREMSYRAKERAAKKIFKKIDGRFDALYSHFFSSGRTALALSCMYTLPVFVAHGESDFVGQIKRMGEAQIQPFYEGMQGVIAVSSHIKREILSYASVDEEKIAVEPNGTNREIFHPGDKIAVRKHLGIPPDETVVLFVGTMIERKGPRRLASALKGLEDVHGYFIGKGTSSLPEEDTNIHIVGEQVQSKVVQYMQAADIFALPTLAEGSSNVIVEALACGLPVISSDRDFNEDILDDSCSILVDPLDIKQLRAAIMTLAGDEQLRSTIAEAALRRGIQLDIRERAKRILSFMEGTID